MPEDFIRVAQVPIAKSHDGRCPKTKTIKAREIRYIDNCTGIETVAVIAGYHKSPHTMETVFNSPVLPLLLMFYASDIEKVILQLQRVIVHKWHVPNDVWREDLFFTDDAVVSACSSGTASNYFGLSSATVVSRGFVGSFVLLWPSAAYFDWLFWYLFPFTGTPSLSWRWWSCFFFLYFVFFFVCFFFFYLLWDCGMDWKKISFIQRTVIKMSANVSSQDCNRDNIVLQNMKKMCKKSRNYIWMNEIVSSWIFFFKKTWTILRN